MRQLQNSQRAHQGFTLVEIAIVLVIIGLLLGGVLKGQELITSAKVRSLNNNLSGTTAAWYAFQDRFQAKPGDYAEASSTINDSLDNGDGDGIVDNGNERGDVWAHLSLSGLISGNFDSGAVPQTAYNCPVTTCPNNGFGNGINISFANEGSGNTGNSNEIITGRLIPSTILAELDRKIDDGLPNSGSMRLGNGGVGWNAAASAACLNGTEYQTVDPSDNCAAVLRNL